MAINFQNGSNHGLPTTLSEINVTPLVDVMLVLLIIFMVTASVETVRVERELERNRVERDLVPPKPEEPENPLKDVPVVVPNINVKQIKESEKKEPKVVLARDLTFRLNDTVVVDCIALTPELANLPHNGDNDQANALFDQCATKAAQILGPNALIQEKKRINFAADRTMPWAWTTRFMALMGVQHGIKQVNIVVTQKAPPTDK
jgi:biopolymer transport protein ExbD